MQNIGNKNKYMHRQIYVRNTKILRDVRYKIKEYVCMYIPIYVHILYILYTYIRTYCLVYIYGFTE